MTAVRISPVWGTILLTITIFSLSLPAYARYSGGTGEPSDPYQIATFEDLMLLAETPGEYYKHFILTADIDLDPNLPGRKVFDKSVIAPDIDPNDRYSSHQGGTFTGVFDGNGHTISNLTIMGDSYLGLFGLVEFGANVKNLGMVDVNITGSGDYVGGLMGWNEGSISSSYSTGSVSGKENVGGLVGVNYSYGRISLSYSSTSVSGTGSVGGLVGLNNGWGSISSSYSSGVVSGTGDCVGGFVGLNYGNIIVSYSTGTVSGDYVGGLVGNGDLSSVTQSVWDVETSGLSGSAGGVGLTTAEMMNPHILGLNGFANNPNWILDASAVSKKLV